MPELVQDASLAPPMGPYCYAVAAGGLVFLGGTPGTTADALIVDGIPKGRMAGETPGRADMVAQTIQAIESIRYASKLAGANWSNAIRFNLFLENWKEVDPFLKTYRGAIGVASPAETLTGYGLYQPSMIMEIDGILSLTESHPISGPGFGAHPYLPVHAGKRTGNLVCLSAIMPIDERGNLISRGSAEAQTRQVLMNLERIMHGAGAPLSDVVRLRVFINDMRDYEAVQKTIDSTFTKDRPLCTIVGAGNPLEGARLMVEPTAYLGAKAYFDGPGNARAVRLGDLIFTNGVLPLEGDSVIAADQAAKQTRTVLTNLSKVLERAGSSIRDVCQSQVSISDFRDYDDYNGVYTDFFQFPYAARHTVQVGLGDSSQTGIRYQIEATAVVGAHQNAKVVTAQDNFYHRRVALGRRA